MFFFFPAGHEQGVYSFPWRTVTLMLLCTVIWYWQSAAQTDAERDLDDLEGHIADQLRAAPEARIGPALFESLPSGLQRPYRGLVAATDADPAIDLELELSLIDLGRVWRAQPLVRWGHIPAEHRLVPLFASNFLHLDWDHLFSNLLIIYLLGAVIECFWSGGAYLGLILLSGLGASIAHQIALPQDLAASVGASGIVSGLMAAFLVGHGRTRVGLWYLVIFPFFKYGRTAVPAWWLIGLSLGLDLWHTLQASDHGISYAAHVGGFVTGLLCTLVARRQRWIAQDAGVA